MTMEDLTFGLVESGLKFFNLKLLESALKISNARLLESGLKIIIKDYWNPDFIRQVHLKVVQNSPLVIALSYPQA